MVCTFAIEYVSSPTISVSGNGSPATPFSFTNLNPGEITDSPTITVAGSGTTADPWILTAVTPDLGQIADSPTVTVTGTGTAADPWILTAVGGGGSTAVINASSTISVAGDGSVGTPYVLSVIDTAITAAPTAPEKLAPNYPNNVVDPTPLALYTELRIDDGLASMAEVWRRGTTGNGAADWVQVM